MVKEALYTELINSRRQSGIAPITPNRRGPGNMKKYYQAALIAVALLSLVSLLFYRHEYNRLRYVLEVLNFYGKPGAKDAEQNCPGGNSGVEKSEILFNSPLPSWQRLNDELFVYSAHSIKKNEIRAVAFGKSNDNLNMNCNVYFEGKAPVSGIFRQSKIVGNSEYSGYQLSCEYLGPGIPEGVAFFNGQTSSGNDAPITNVRNSLQNLMTDEIALCVAPPMNRSISRTDLISFLNFHQIIGVGHFVVYDYGVPSRFVETVRDVMVSQGLNFTLTIIPWNFPFVEFPQDVAKGIIEKDCLYRTYNEVEYSATLYWEEYMVLKYHRNLLELLKDFEKTTPSSKRYFIDTSVFCTQQKDDKDSTDVMPTVFKKISKISSSSVKTRDIYISKPHESLDLGNADTIKADTDLINVNHYRYCSNSINEFSYVEDKSILRFANDMFDASIYKEYITRQSFSSK